jgi:hypothetical protein
LWGDDAGAGAGAGAAAAHAADVAGGGGHASRAWLRSQAALPSAPVLGVGLAAALRGDPTRLDASSRVPVSASPEAGGVLAASPALATPLAMSAYEEADAGARCAARAFAASAGAARAARDAAREAALAESGGHSADAAPLGAGVLPSGRWSWSLVVEASAALAAPLPQPLTRFREAAAAAGAGGYADGAGAAGAFAADAAAPAFELAVALMPALGHDRARAGAALRGTDPDAHAVVWMLTNRGHLFLRPAPLPGAPAGAPLPGLVLVACGLPWGVSSHLVVAVDTADAAAALVGVSVANSRGLAGVSAAEQAAALAAALGAAVRVPAPVALYGGARAADAPGAAPAALPEQLLTAVLDGAPPPPPPPGAPPPPSQLCAPHNAHHPLELPMGELAPGAGAGGGALVTALHSADPLAGPAAALHGAVAALPLERVLRAAALDGARRLPCGVAALQFALFVRDADGVQVTLLPPPQRASRAEY